MWQTFGQWNVRGSAFLDWASKKPTFSILFSPAAELKEHMFHPDGAAMDGKANIGLCPWVTNPCKLHNMSEKQTFVGLKPLTFWDSLFLRQNVAVCPDYYNPLLQMPFLSPYLDPFGLALYHRWSIWFLNLPLTINTDFSSPRIYFHNEESAWLF